MAHSLASCFPLPCSLDAQNPVDRASSIICTIRRPRAWATPGPPLLRHFGRKKISYCVKTESTQIAERQEGPGCSALSYLMLPRDLVSLVPPQLLNFSSASASSQEQLPRPHIHHLRTRTLPQPCRHQDI